MFTTPAFDFLTPSEPNSVVGAGSPFNNAGTSNTNNASASPYNNFDMNPVTTWQPPSNPSGSEPMMFDELFRGYLTSLAPPDFMSFMSSTPSISPIAHHSSPSIRLSSAPSLSPSILGEEPLFSRTPSSSTTDADSSMAHSPATSTHQKSRSECRAKIAQEGDSMFGPPVQKNQDQILGTMITCAGSSFPKTEKNDQNIEVLTALKNIRSDPKFKVCLTKFYSEPADYYHLGC
jgi:AP-1-like factor